MVVILNRIKDHLILHPSLYVNDGEISLDGDDEEELLVEKPAPKYLEIPLRERNAIEKLVLGKHHPGNRHERLFFLEKRGPDFILHMTRTILLITAIFIAGFPVRFFQMIAVDVPELWLRIIVYVLMLAPIPPIVVMIIMIIERHTICCSIEMMKNKKDIETLSRKATTRRAVKILTLLHSIKFFCKKRKKN